MKARKIVETHRGGLTVADPKELSAIACGCKGSVRRHFDEVLKGVYPDELATLNFSSGPTVAARDS